MDYVSDEAAQRARRYVKKFQDLSPDAGVLLIAVNPVPAPGGRVTHFDFVIGLSHLLESSIGPHIVRSVLIKELEREELIIREVTSVVGYPGAAGSHYQDHDRPRAPTA
jgi:hypothetical protein